ncbi:MAG: LPS translocon maturation chaperone LptM, partial [Ramlibacter sp.]
MPIPSRSLRAGPMPRAVAAAAVLALTACGQRGPLYLPTDPAAAGRPTLPQVLIPGTPTNPTTPPVTDLPGNVGTGTANPV